MDPRRLREETRTEHEATEALMPLTGETLSLAVYRRTLAVLYPLLRSWEAWSDAAAPESLRPLLAARRRSHLLAADLAALGGEPDSEVPNPVDWDAVVGAQGVGRHEEGFHAAFVGALYVLEGSTLGGRYIARHVESVLGLVPGEGDAYFQGHGEATGSMWREVTGQIAAVPEELAPVVIAAARRTLPGVWRGVASGRDCTSSGAPLTREHRRASKEQ